MRGENREQRNKEDMMERGKKYKKENPHVRLLVFK